MTSEIIVCTPVRLPDDELIPAALTAININPVNRPPVERLDEMLSEVMAAVTYHGQPAPIPTSQEPILTPQHLAVLTTKYWGAGGVQLEVGFMDNPPSDLRDRIMSHFHAWSEFCNAKFVYTKVDPQVRIGRDSSGHWSFLGPDILRIARNKATMNLQGFTMSTPESEFRRVIRHEVGHTLGFPHEHMRKELILRLDEAKVLDYFRRTQGWSAATTRQQVLTPLEESSLLGTDHADDDSIMCYQLPGSITIDGRPIPGGMDIDAEDRAFAAKVYPLPVQPPQPPGASRLVIEFSGGYKIISG